jgi:predicted Zn-dependent peptidase
VKVVKQERGQSYENAPYGMSWQFIHEAVYPADHPYHHITIGSTEDLDAATVDDVKAFFKTFYAPNNATLVVAGDFVKADAMALVTKYFGPIARADAPPHRTAPAVSLSAETRQEANAGVELPRVYVTWPTPAFFADGDAQLDVLARVLSSGKTSRLYKRLVYDDQIAQDVSAFQASSQLGSLFVVQATAKPGHTADELLKVIDEELAKVRGAGVGQAELDRAKTKLLSESIFGIERDGARANLVNEYNHYVGDPGYLPKDVARHQSVTAEALRAAMTTWLPPGRRVVTVFNPLKGAPISGVLARTTTTVQNGGAQ